MAYNRDKLATEFCDATGCNIHKAIKYIQRYEDALRCEVVKHIGKMRDGFYFVSNRELMRKIGFITVNNERHYIWKTITEKCKHKAHRIHTVGNNIEGKLTMIELDEQFENMLFDTENYDDYFRQLYSEYGAEISNDHYHTVPVNLTSLKNFIEDSKSRIEKATNHNYKKTLEYNLTQAKRFYAIAYACNGDIPHIISEKSGSGRVYYKGPNLQNTSKVVRKAALGKCHEYDLENSVFTIKLVLAAQANPDINPVETLNYIDYKVATRKSIAQAVFGNSYSNTVDIIKEAITAIAFGAKSTGYYEKGSYHRSALEEIIKSPEKRTTFLNHPAIVQLIAEQTELNKIITKAFKGDCPELLEESRDRGGRVKPNAFTMRLYNKVEGMIMDTLSEYANRGREEANVLLRVHDCIYTRYEFKVNEAVEELVNVLGLTYKGRAAIQISHDQCGNWAYDAELSKEERLLLELEKAVEKGYMTPEQAGLEIQRKKRADAIINRQISQPAADGVQNDHYDGSGHNGLYYDPEIDPFYQEEF